MKAVEVVIPKKNEIAAMADEDLVLYYGRIVELERMVKEMKKLARNELIARYGTNAEHVVGDFKLIIEERSSMVLDTKEVKRFLAEMGRLDEFTKERRSIYIFVK